MTQFGRAAIAGAALLLVTACNLRTASAPSPAEVEATVSARVAATLTAAAFDVEAARVTATVQAATVAGQAAAAPPATPTPPPSSPGAPSPTPLMPVITAFTCDPCTLEPGGSATLSWDLSGATSAALDGQGVPAPGSTIVRPDQTTTYRLSAVNDHGQSEKTVTVEVRGLPVIHYFTCLPCQVSKGQSSTLSWDLSGATAAYMDEHGVPAPGSSVVAPDRTTTYRLKAVGEQGSVERLVTVTVKEGGDPATVSDALRGLGYAPRSVGYLPLDNGGQTISVIMPAASGDFHSQAIADQYWAGLKALYDNYPGQALTVGLYDGTRYIVFVTAPAAVFESLLRGETDSRLFWQAVRWNVWDEWTAAWTTADSGPPTTDN
jgi:hypothetical protein